MKMLSILILSTKSAELRRMNKTVAKLLEREGRRKNFLEAIPPALQHEEGQGNSFGL